MPKISVLVSVYNLSHYISNCIESILNQTFKDFELIIVDDGSKDNSFSLIKNFAYKNNRIKVFHKKNGGANSARNYALKKATGDYITFVDGDDILPEYSLELMYSKAIENNLDSVIGNQYKINTKADYTSDIIQKSYEPAKIYKDKIITFKDINLHDFWYQMWCITAPARLDKRKLYEDLYFNEHIKMGEDQITIKEIMFKAKRIMILDNYTYLYVYHPNSLTRKRRYEAIDIFKSFEKMKELLKKYNLYEKLYTSFISYYYWCIWYHLIAYFPFKYFPIFLIKFYFFNLSIKYKKLDSLNTNKDVLKMIEKYRNPLYFMIHAPLKALKDFFHKAEKNNNNYNIIKILYYQFF